MVTGIGCLRLFCQGSTSDRSPHAPLTLLAGRKAASPCRFLFCLQVSQKKVQNDRTPVCALVTNHSALCPRTRRSGSLDPGHAHLCVTMWEHVLEGVFMNPDTWLHQPSPLGSSNYSSPHPWSLYLRLNTSTGHS